MTVFGDWYSWIICIGLLVLNAVFVFGAWWALFADRAKGRRRCPRCWYDMAYSPGMTCGECGFSAKNESQFSKTRRRFGLAMLAVAASTASVLYVNFQASQRGLPSLLPSRVLIWLIPFSGDANSTLAQEIAIRANAKRLSTGDWSSLLRRCATGDWFTSPVSDSWIEKYGTMIDRLQSAMPLKMSEFDQLLGGIPPRVDLKTRDVWPIDAPVIVTVQVRDWWVPGNECRVLATPRLPNARMIVLERAANDWVIPQLGFPLSLPTLDPAVREVAIDFEIQRRPRVASLRHLGSSTAAVYESEPANLVPWEPAAKITATVKTFARGTVEEFFNGVDSPVMSQAVRQAFASRVMKWAAGPSPVRFSIDPQQTFIDDFNDTAVGVRAELYCDDILVRRLNVWWLAGDNAAGTGGGSTAGYAGPGGWSGRPASYGFEIDFEDEARLLNLPANGDDESSEAPVPDRQSGGRLELRLKGDPLLSLRAGKASRYWTGETKIKQPTVQLSPDNAPPRAWTVIRQE